MLSQVLLSVLLASTPAASWNALKLTDVATDWGSLQLGDSVVLPQPVPLPAIESVDPNAPPEPMPVEEAAKKWARVGEAVQVVSGQVAVPCPSGQCPASFPRFRTTYQTVQVWQWEPTKQWAHVVSDENGVIGIRYFDPPDQKPRWVQAPKFSKEDKKYFIENHWRFSMPTCAMSWCVNHGGGWLLEAVRVPVPDAASSSASAVPVAPVVAPAPVVPAQPAGRYQWVGGRRGGWQWIQTQ